MPYMELFVSKLDQHAPCFAISEKAYGEYKHGEYIINTDEDPSLQIESFSIINLRGVSTKLN